MGETSGNSHSEAALEVPRFLGEECTWLEPAFQMLGLEPEMSHVGHMLRTSQCKVRVGALLEGMQGKGPGESCGEKAGFRFCCSPESPVPLGPLLNNTQMRNGKVPLGE